MENSVNNCIDHVVTKFDLGKIERNFIYEFAQVILIELNVN